MLIRLEDADFKDRAQQAQAQLDQAKATLDQNRAKIGLRQGQKFAPENVPKFGLPARPWILLIKICGVTRSWSRVETFRAPPMISRCLSAIKRPKQYQALIHQAQQNLPR